MFIHHVYFWLKPDAPATAAQQIIDDCRSLLARIPGVEHLWAGPPAGTPRSVVDNSYAVGLAVVLADTEAHEVYQAHPPASGVQVAKQRRLGAGTNLRLHIPGLTGVLQL